MSEHLEPHSCPLLQHAHVRIQLEAQTDKPRGDWAIKNKQRRTSEGYCFQRKIHAILLAVFLGSQKIQGTRGKHPVEEHTKAEARCRTSKTWNLMPIFFLLLGLA